MSNEFKHTRKSKMELWLDDHIHEMELIRTMVALFYIGFTNNHIVQDIQWII